MRRTGSAAEEKTRSAGIAREEDCFARPPLHCSRVQPLRPRITSSRVVAPLGRGATRLVRIAGGGGASLNPRIARPMTARRVDGKLRDRPVRPRCQYDTESLGSPGWRAIPMMRKPQGSIRCLRLGNGACRLFPGSTRANSVFACQRGVYDGQPDHTSTRRPAIRCGPATGAPRPATPPARAGSQRPGPKDLQVHTAAFRGSF